MTTIEAINCAERIALRSDGVTVPITQLFDSLGRETDDIEEAVSYVAGAGAEWFSGLLADFSATPSQ